MALISIRSTFTTQIGPTVTFLKAKMKPMWFIASVGDSESKIQCSPIGETLMSVQLDF